MGRPKKEPMIPPTDIENAIADILSKWCGIPGCMPRNHIHEVRELTDVLDKKGFYISKKRVD